MPLSFFLFVSHPYSSMCVWKPGWASHWSVAKFLVSRVCACFAVSPVSEGGRAPKPLPPLSHRGWLRSEKPRYVNHYGFQHLGIHLSIKRKWSLHPPRSQLNGSNSRYWMRARFQCRALCGQATAQCCHIKAVILTPSVKRYGTPPHIQHSGRPIAGTVRLDQWINGCIELWAESVGVPGVLQCRASWQSNFVPQVHVCE